jgi:hypothetical protein
MNMGLSKVGYELSTLKEIKEIFDECIVVFDYPWVMCKHAMGIRNGLQSDNSLDEDEEVYFSIYFLINFN